jgi:hypothetical protein
MSRATLMISKSNFSQRVGPVQAKVAKPQITPCVPKTIYICPEKCMSCNLVKWISDGLEKLVMESSIERGGSHVPKWRLVTFLWDVRIDIIPIQHQPPYFFGRASLSFFY